MIIYKIIENFKILYVLVPLCIDSSIRVIDSNKIFETNKIESSVIAIRIVGNFIKNP